MGARKTYLLSARPVSVLVAAVVLAPALVGCGFVRVSVNRPGAQLYLSQNGTAPWSPIDSSSRWFVRERAAEPTADSAADAESATGSESIETYWLWRPIEGYCFLRAEAEDYHPARPVLVDFSKLGFRRIELELQPTLALQAREKLAQGLVYRSGRWIDPEAEGLVRRGDAWMTADEATAWDRKEAGLVEFEGEWLTPAERAARLAAQRAALGLVEFKGQFVRPDEAERFRQIDGELDSMAKRFATDDQATTSVGSLELTGPYLGEAASLKLFVASGFGVQILVSGDRFTDSFSLQAWNDTSVELPPGGYRIGAVPATPGLGSEFYGTFELRGQLRYTFVYSGKPREVRDLDEILSENLIEDVEIPTIEVPELPERDAKPPSPNMGGRDGGRPRGRRR